MAASVSQTISRLIDKSPIIPEKRQPNKKSGHDQWPSLLQTAVVATALKVLLFPAYKSTDFEVHRNWLAVTHSVPAKEWYHETTSEWTLDYPPAFALFEWLLSWPASLIDVGMVQIHNLNYDSWATVCFQRGSVIITELLLVYALHKYTQISTPSTRRQSHAVALSILLSPGFLIVDHIHFQYNGFLYSILILSVVFAKEESTMLLSGILFALLICLKHIYLYLAPAYFVYLLRVYCLNPNNSMQPQFANILKLGTSILAVFGAALGPFVAWDQIDQLRSRLFPFARGLCHAYWAPNAWAVYSFLDRVLIIAAPYLGLVVDKDAVTSLTRGLVGDTSFAVLPEITTEVCFGLTVAFQMVALTKLWLVPNWESFVGALTLCGYASFLFGWHVHEKAILLVIIPFSLLAVKDRSYLASFRPLAVAGHVSLFPLLFTAAEFPIKVAYTISWLIIFLYTFDQLAPAPSRRRVFLLDRFALFYIAISVPLMAYCSLLHQLIFGEQYEFLPLMFISTYSAIGVLGSWLGFMVCYLSEKTAFSL